MASTPRSSARPRMVNPCEPLRSMESRAARTITSRSSPLPAYVVSAACLSTVGIVASQPIVPLMCPSRSRYRREDAEGTVPKPPAPSLHREPPVNGSRARSCELPAEARVALDVGVDVLLADLLVDRHLLRDGLGVEPDPLHRNGFLLDHRALLVQHGLVLLLADRRAREGIATVGLGDRLPLQANRFATDRHGLRHVLGDHVLPQARPPG